MWLATVSVEDGYVTAGARPANCAGVTSPDPAPEVAVTVKFPVPVAPLQAAVKE